MLKSIKLDGSFVVDFVLTIGTTVNLGNAEVKRTGRTTYQVTETCEDYTSSYTTTKKNILSNLPSKVNGLSINRVSKMKYKVNGKQLKKSDLLLLINKRNVKNVLANVILTAAYNVEHGNYKELHGFKYYPVSSKDYTDSADIRKNSVELMNEKEVAAYGLESGNYINLFTQFNDLLNCELFRTLTVKMYTLEEMVSIVSKECSQLALKFMLKNR